MMDIEPQPEDLSASETRFLTTFNQAAVGIAHVSEQGDFIRVNQKTCEMLGYSKQELLGLTFQEITHPEDLKDDLDALHELILGKIETYTMEKRYIRKNGTLIWGELTVSIVRIPGKAPYFISVIVDIDARKMAEAALHQAHLQLAREREFVQLERDNFFHLSRDVMAITNFQDYFVRVNPALCELLNYSSEELTSSPVFSFIHPDDREATRAFRQFLLSGKQTEFEHFEIRLMARDGSAKWISWAGRAVPGSANYVTGRDITNRKAEELAAKQRQILMTTNLKLNAIGLMAANMAHEINNPLTIIYGEACILRKMVENADANPKKLARIAGNVVKMSERIVSIVNGLRSLSRDGSSDPMRTIPLRQVLEDTIPFCRGKITSDNIELNVEDLVANVYVCCRSVQLSQALLNLLNNAYDAVVDLPEPGRIDVFIRQTHSRVEICVRDSGPGVPEEIRKTLFQPFTSSKEVGRGLGLGLSISRDMIEANGGQLFLAEATPQTTFVISLPRVISE